MTKPFDLEEVANRILKELSVISCIGDSKGIQYSIKSNITFFVKQRIKSAVQELLEEIDKLPTETIFDKVAETEDGMAIAPFEFIKKEPVIDLIKKWFPVFKEEK